MGLALQVCLCFLAVQTMANAVSDLPTPKFAIKPSKATKDLFPLFTLYSEGTRFNHTEFRCTHTKPDGSTNQYACNSTVILGGAKGLEEGSHLLEVLAENRSINAIGKIKESYAFIVDTTYPQIKMDSHKSNRNNSTNITTIARNMTFQFHSVGRLIKTDASSTGGLSLEKEDPCSNCQLFCRLDSLPWTLCTSPKKYIQIGTPGQFTIHQFQVKAVDNFKLNSSVAAYWWKIDLAPPKVTFVQKPASVINQRDATFRITTTEPAGSTPRFQCTFDNTTRFPCFIAESSPGVYQFSLSNMTIGNHSFTVYAFDVYDNEATGKTYTFSAGTTVPVVMYQSNIWAVQGTQASDPVLQNGSYTEVRTVTFRFGVASENLAECKLDSSQWQSCVAGSFTARNLTSGIHTFRVRAKSPFDTFTPASKQPVWTWVVVACPLPVAPANGQLIRTATFSDQDSWQFSCNSGYSLSGPKSVTCKNGITSDISNTKCSDTDECKTGQHNCAQTALCQNNIASYQCSCRRGYSGDGKTCREIDECAGDQSPCDAQATCANTAGSFSCTCDSGYVGDGRNCTVEIISPTGGLQGGIIGGIIAGVLVVFLLIGVALYLARSAEYQIGSVSKDLKSKLQGFSRGGLGSSFRRGSRIGAPNASATCLAMPRDSIVSSSSIEPLPPLANLTSHGSLGVYTDTSIPTTLQIAESACSDYDTAGPTTYSIADGADNNYDTVRL